VKKVDGVQYLVESGFSVSLNKGSVIASKNVGTSETVLTLRSDGDPPSTQELFALLDLYESYWSLSDIMKLKAWSLLGKVVSITTEMIPTRIGPIRRSYTCSIGGFGSAASSMETSIKESLDLAEASWDTGIPKTIAQDVDLR